MQLQDTVSSLQGRLQAVAAVAEENAQTSSRKWEKETQVRMQAQHEALFKLESFTQAALTP